MAKGNPLLGQMRGSIGDVVFWRGNGQQLSRSRNRQPANPRSNSQLTTRILLKTASTAYSKLMYDYANQTFQGSKIGAENQRRFMSANIKILRDYIDQGSDDLNFMGRDDTAAMLNRYRVSEGNLPSINATVANPVSGSTSVIVGPLFTPAAAVPTYQEVCDAFGVAPGTQLSFLLCHIELGTISYVQRKRIILAPASGDMSLPFYVGTEINDPNPANDALGLIPNFSGNHLQFEAFGDFFAAAVVASYYDGSKWAYSTEQIWYSPLAGLGVHTLAQAIASWQAPIAGSDEYTRQANAPETGGGDVGGIPYIIIPFDSGGQQFDPIEGHVVQGATILAPANLPSGTAGVILQVTIPAADDEESVTIYGLDEGYGYSAETIAGGLLVTINSDEAEGTYSGALSYNDNIVCGFNIDF